jgi:drug/metabolite transporter (DMT)-like permease
MLLAVFFVALFVWYKKINIRVSKTLFWQLIGAGIIIALHWVTFFKAIKVSNVSVTLACMSTGAFFTALIEPFWYKRKIIWYEIAFGLIVIIGLYVIFNVEGGYTEGIILALISALLSAIFSLINGKLVHHHKPSLISFYELLGGVLFLTVYFIVSGAFDANFFQLQASDWMYLGILASVCTAYAFIASVKVMKFISPYTVMLTINLEPVYGILLAFFVLGSTEKMSSSFYIGALIILCTVLANGILKNKRSIKSKFS